MDKLYQAVRDFHRKFKMKGTNNEDLIFRICLMVEELGELAQTVSKGRPRQQVIEENVDLLYLVLGNFISLGLDYKGLERAFLKKHRRNMKRKVKPLSEKDFRVLKIGDFQSRSK